MNFSAIFSVFGESDSASTTFGVDMLNWRSNYITDVGEILGTTNTALVMYHTQQPSYTNQNANTNMLWLHVNHYGSNQLVGPKLQVVHVEFVQYQPAPLIYLLQARQLLSAVLFV